ncbi:MAG TPA: hypothetical protein VK789_16000 [Bryobacteraceae bacterium]|nr:hypothetical protein [Bryobacteraceae bacterium]
MKRRIFVRRWIPVSLAVAAVAVGLTSCDSQTENNTTGGGALKQGNGEKDALGSPGANPGRYPASDSGGVARQ